MGYKIRYNSWDDKKYPSGEILKGRKIRRGIIILLVIISVLVATRYRHAWLPILLPGNGEVTMVAFTDLFADIRKGEYSTDSISTFYNQILSDGQS